MMFSRLKQIAKEIIPFRVRIYWVGFSPGNRISNKQKLTHGNALHHNSQQNMNAFFSDTRKVEAYLGDNRLRFYDEVLNLLQLKGLSLDNKHIADVGCGTGHLLYKASHQGQLLSITGFDYSEAALNIARDLIPSAKFFCSDIYDDSGLQYDIVFCTEVLEHLLYPEKALGMVLKMVGEQGALIITVPNGRNDTYEGHINFWSPESWEIFVKNSCVGFDIDVGKIGLNANYAIIRKV